METGRAACWAEMWCVRLLKRARGWSGGVCVTDRQGTNQLAGFANSPGAIATTAVLATLVGIYLLGLVYTIYVCLLASQERRAG